MTLNKTKIEWCDYTFNPVTGCKHGCSYCYARKIAERFKGSKAWPKGFEPMIHNERSADPMKMKKPQTIFVCSMADLFGDWVPDEWISNVMASCDAAPWHTYIFLTKNPKRYLTLPNEYFQKNRWFGTSLWESKISWGRNNLLTELAENGANTFLSIEPLKELPDISAIPWFGKAKSIIVGMETNPNRPCDYGVLSTIIVRAEINQIPIFLKDSVIEAYGENLKRSYRSLCWSVHK